MSINYYIVDTETTGLKAGFHEINQISVMRCSDMFQKSYRVAVKNPWRASPEALNIQRISKEDLKNGDSLIDVISGINEFLKEDGGAENSRCFIGHNVSFDRRFIHAAWSSEKVKLPVDLWMCTKKFYKSYVTKVGEEKIKTLQATAGVQHPKVKYGQDMCLLGAGLELRDGAHSASVDVQQCFELWNFLMNEDLNHVRVIETQPHKLPASIDYLQDI